jgi:hypothetical protein
MMNFEEKSLSCSNINLQLSVSPLQKFFLYACQLLMSEYKKEIAGFSTFKGKGIQGTMHKCSFFHSE